MADTKTVVVYTKRDCLQCDQTKKVLDRRGVPYREVSLEDNPQALAQVKAWGFRAAPIVDIGKDRWGGFRYDKLLALKGP